MELRTRRQAFTLVELLIFSAIFGLVIIGFVTVLVSATSVQTQQLASAGVEQESQFLLQQIQYYVEASSLVDMSQDTSTSTLVLRMSSSSTDPTVITLTNGAVTLKQGTGPTVPLTSSKVSVANLTFKKLSNPPGHDVVSIGFTVNYVGSVTQSFSQAFQASIAHVNAATFDSSLIPSTTATYSVGVTGNTWSSVNNILYFSSSSNVGIGVSTPQDVLEVNGGLRLNTATSQPTCSSAHRGLFWVTESGASIADAVQVCVKTSSDTYTWVSIATVP